MVVESRADPKYGGEDLQSIAWLCFGVGGFLSFFLESTVDPKNEGCFLIAAVSAGLLACASLLLNKKLEVNQAERVVMGAGTRIRLVITGLCYGIRIKELFTAFLFQLLFGLAPTFLIYLDEYELFFANLTLADYWKIQMFGWLATIVAVVIYAVLL